MTFDKRSSEYQNYLIAREQKPSTVKQQFSEVRNKTRTDARTKHRKQDKVSDVEFITTYNPALSNINKIIQNNLSIPHTDEDMKKLFPPDSITTIYRREKNLKETLSPTLFPPKFNKTESLVSNCNKCNICKNYLISDNKFKCKVNVRVHSNRGSLSCNRPNVVFFIPCKNCEHLHVGSATNSKTTIPDKIFGTKWSNPVKLDRKRNVRYQFLRVF